MSDERDLAEEARRGEHAKALLEDPILIEMLERMEAHYIETWRKSGTSDVQVRERAWMQCALVNDFRQQLRTVAEGGQLARSVLERMRRR